MDINSYFDYVSNIFSSDAILNFVFHPEFSGALLFVKIIFIIISAVLIINIFYLVALSSWFSDRYGTNWKELSKFDSIDAQEISKKWQTIEKRMKTNKETELKLAVIEAEESLISMLRMAGNEGPTLKEQLTQAGPDDLSNIDDIIDAHNFRNKIINNPDEPLDLGKARKAVESFKEAFEDLQA